jgi:hypothetical protein
MSRIRIAKWAVVAAASFLFGGCATLPPILQRWADLEIATANLVRQDSKTGESLSFDQDGRVAVNWKSSDTPKVRWRVRGPWLEIDTDNDGSFKMRLRALTWTKDRIIAVSPTGERSVWRDFRVVVVIQMVPQRPGMWMP